MWWVLMEISSADPKFHCSQRFPFSFTECLPKDCIEMWQVCFFISPLCLLTFSKIVIASISNNKYLQNSSCLFNIDRVTHREQQTDSCRVKIQYFCAISWHTLIYAFLGFDFSGLVQINRYSYGLIMLTPFVELLHTWVIPWQNEYTASSWHGKYSVEIYIYILLILNLC